MDTIEILKIETSNFEPNNEVRQLAINSLESGKVVFCPKLSFSVNPWEKKFLSPSVLNKRSKNVSYDLKKDELHGTSLQGEDAEQLRLMIHRFALFAKELVANLFPFYLPNLLPARTSFRPVEVAGRKLSHLKDDTLLHVDSFPSNPVKGNRIFRVFSNINPEGKPRIWEVGEPFLDVVDKMTCRIKNPLPGFSYLLKALQITKGYRTLYDHYMLKIHDNMKLDAEYQKKVSKKTINFPAGSTWMVYTDLVSHAVLSGQHVLEQTFYLPTSSMKFEQKSPLKMLEKKLNRRLV